MMISATSSGSLNISSVLRQQTERKAEQAEQQARALESLAAAKRREARQAEADAKQLDTEANDASATATRLNVNLAAADRTIDNNSKVTDRLNLAISTAISDKPEGNAAPDISPLNDKISNMLSSSTNQTSGVVINIKV